MIVLCPLLIMWNLFTVDERVDPGFTFTEQVGSAVNLRYILEWAWDKAVKTKEELDSICKCSDHHHHHHHLTTHACFSSRDVICWVGFWSSEQH